MQVRKAWEVNTFGIMSKLIMHVEGMPSPPDGIGESWEEDWSHFQTELDDWQEKLRGLVSDLSINVTEIAGLIK